MDLEQRRGWGISLPRNSVKAESKETILILGAGYAGLNTFYRIRKGAHVQLISSSDVFVFQTARLRSVILNDQQYTTSIRSIVTKAIIKDVDMNSRVVITDHGRYESDIIVIALGSRRNDFDMMLDKVMHADRVSLASESRYDEYIALQIAFYLRRKNRHVVYAGGLMDWLGADVSQAIHSALEEEGIKLGDRADYIIPEAQPAEPFDSFIKVDENLMANDSVYAAGDIVDMGPKNGEVSMRMGLHVANSINRGKSLKFEPTFVYIMDTGRGKGIHVKSDLPWGGNYQNVKVSSLRLIFKRFIEKYYIWRRGKMGFLEFF